MSKRIVGICLLVVFAFFAGAAMSHGSKGTQPAAQESSARRKCLRPKDTMFTYSRLT